MHFVCFPTSFIVSVIFPKKSTFPIKLVIYEFSFIVAFIWPRKFTFFLMPVFETAFKYCTIRPILFPITLLFVIYPLTSIEYSLKMSELAIAMSWIVFPHSVVIIFIRMYVQSFITKLIILETSVVICPIQKIHLPITLQHFALIFVYNISSKITGLTFLTRTELYFNKFLFLYLIFSRLLESNAASGYCQLFYCLMHIFYQLLQIVEFFHWYFVYYFDIDKCGSPRA